MSIWKLKAFSCSSRMPPWLWTMALGSPVVPEENRIHSGCEKGTCSNLNSDFGTGRAASRSSQNTVGLENGVRSAVFR